MKCLRIEWLLLLVVPMLAGADVLTLPNGDRVSGTLTGGTAEQVTFMTPFGTLEVAPAALTSLETDAPRAVKSSGGAVHSGLIAATSDALTVTDGQAVVSLPWAEVAAIAADVEALTVALAPLDAAPPETAPAPADAETAVAEAAAEEERKKLWSGHVESGLTLRRGNTDTLDFTLASGLKREAEENVLTIKGLAGYGEAEEVINTRRFQGEAKWQVYPQERWYWYVLGGAERDDGRKLALRTNAAAGLGRDFLKAERRSLSADLGLDYAWERWVPYTPAEKDSLKETRRAGALEGLRTVAEGLSGGAVTPGLDTYRAVAGHLSTYFDPLGTDFDREEQYLSLRGSATYSQTLFTESTLSTALTAFANVDDFGEYRVNNELAFATPLTEVLKLKVTLRTEYNSLAEEKGAQPWDNTLVTELRYEF